MVRRRVSLLAIALGVACVVSLGASVYAQNPPANQGKPGGQGGNARASDPAQSIEKALQSYQKYRDQVGERIGKSADQCRQDIERMVKELTELTEMRYQLTLSLAELRARGQNATYSAGYRGAEFAGAAGRGQGTTQGEGMQHQQALSRELSSVENQIRSEVEQTRSQADQLANQLRSMRDQFNQQKEQQEKAGQEKKKVEPNAPQGQGGAGGQGQGGNAQQAQGRSGQPAGQPGIGQPGQPAGQQGQPGNPGRRFGRGRDRELK
jgi:hypothetical protein